MTRPDLTATINAWCDGVPRTWLFRGARMSPAFRGCGAAALCAASIVAAGGALRAGVSLSILALLIGAGVASFFALAFVRRALTRREELVLLEHLWLALLAIAGATWALGEPVPPYLDVASVGLCAFLAIGRLGCLLVGCCHGVPASAGIVYRPACARDGFADHLVGVRLFPVAAVEAAGWLAIGAVGWLAIPATPPGLVTVWVLLAYAILRFGLEALRGDARPTVLGWTQARWMAALQGAAMLPLVELIEGRAPSARTAAIAAGLVLLTAIAGARRHLADPRRRLLREAHVAEVRAHVRALCDGPGAPPEIRRTRAGGSIGASRDPEGRACHVSLMLPHGTRDLQLLCELAAAALPELELASARVDPETLLHVRVAAPLPQDAPIGPAGRALGDALYGTVLRRYQGCDAAAAAAPADPAAASARAPGQAVDPAGAPRSARDLRFEQIQVYADPAYHRLSENRQEASVASPGSRLPTATPGTG